MKHMKKLASFILALSMMLALAVTASAVDTYSITITNSKSGHTYEAYQILTGTLSTDENNNKVLSDVKWGANAKDKTAGTAVTEDELDAITEDNAAALADLSSTPVASASTQTDGKYVISGLAAGYYLVKDQDNSLSGEDAYTSYIIKVVGDVTAEPKSDVPESEKKVDDKNDSNTSEDTVAWQDSADYDIGDEVPFRLKGTVASNYDSYKTYYFAFHDVEADGLTFNSSSVKVFVDGAEITAGYEVVTDPTDGCTFEVVFSDLKSIASVRAGSEITVTYTSTLNENAVVGAAGNQNKMKLEFSNNPNQEQGGTPETGETPWDIVIVFTYKTVVNKVNESNEPLTGAEFTLYKFVADANGAETYNGVQGDWVAKTMVKNDAGTSFSFTGLDDGVYKLSETTTPAGYNSIADIVFTVTAEHTVESDDPSLTSLSGTAASGEITFTSDLTAGSLSTDVVNKQGSTLPETGGIGTTVFYVAGAILVLGAGILLATRKRMSK